jgi:hypothetical protein
MKQINQTHEYARACSAWVAIKGYYLLFYLETIIHALIAADNTHLKASHDMTRKFMRNICGSSALSANFTSLTTVLNHGECVTTGITGGANLIGKLDDDIRYRQIMKKLKEYSKEEFKRKNNMQRLAGVKADAFNQQKICLLDFFYWYRIKSNYRDLEFIVGESTSSKDLLDYYRMYNGTVSNIASAYEKVINELFQKRTGKKLKILEL